MVYFPSVSLAWALKILLRPVTTHCMRRVRVRVGLQKVSIGVGNGRTGVQLCSAGHSIYFNKNYRMANLLPV